MEILYFLLVVQHITYRRGLLGHVILKVKIRIDVRCSLTMVLFFSDSFGFSLAYVYSLFSDLLH